MISDITGAEATRAGQAGAREPLAQRREPLDRLRTEHEPHVARRDPPPQPVIGGRGDAAPRASPPTRPPASSPARPRRPAATSRPPGARAASPAARRGSRRAGARSSAVAAPTCSCGPRSTASAARASDGDGAGRVVDVHPAGVADDRRRPRDPAHAPADHPVRLRHRADDHRALGHARRARAARPARGRRTAAPPSRRRRAGTGRARTHRRVDRAPSRRGRARSPVGIDGLIISSATVRSVTAAASASRSSRHSPSTTASGANTGTPPASRTRLTSPA